MAKQPAECGTYSGYQRHRHLGEAPCGPCTDAARTYERESKAKRREALAASQNPASRPSDTITRAQHERARELLEKTLTRLETQMDSASPRDIPAIAREVNSTIELIQARESAIKALDKAEEEQANPVEVVDPYARRLTIVADAS